MGKPVIHGRSVRLLIAVFLLALSSAPIWASSGIEPGEFVKVHLPVVLNQVNPDEGGAPDSPDKPGEPDGPGEPGAGDASPDVEFATDLDGQPVKRIGVPVGGPDETAQVIVQLADAPLATYQGNVPGLPATRPAESHLLDTGSSSARAYATYLEKQRAGFKAQLASAIPGAAVVHEFNGTVMQGMAVSLRRDQITSLERLPGVKGVMIVRQHQPLLEFSLPLINAPRFWDQVGGPDNAGAGQRIAIIDTGIDIEDPFFDDAGFSAPPGFPRGDPNFTNDKVIVARAYFTGIENPCGAGNPITPRDFHHHGTHVAGIAAGNYDTPVPVTRTMSVGTLSGVAPRAFLMSYNVFPCEITRTNDIDIMAAIEDAVADGASVVNLSLATPFVGRVEDDLLVQAIESAIAANVVFSVAAGNDGDTAETVSSPGIAPNAITVGASTTETRSGHAINVTGPSPVPPGLLDILAMEGTGLPLTSDLTARYISVGQAFGNPTACDPIYESLVGKIALIRRGGCSFSDKITNVAMNAGAQAVVIYNHPPGEGSLVMSDLEGTTIPSFIVGYYAGLALEDWYKLHPGTAEMVIEASTSWFGRLPDAVANFSARGPNPDWAIKPDVVAPGVDVFSPTQDDPFEGCCTDPSGYAQLSGTSVSAAHVAGAAALIRQRWPSLSVNSLKSALMVNAKTPIWRSDGFAPPPAQAMERGSGRIDLGSGLLGKPARIYPPSHSFGSWNLGNGPITVEQTFTVRRKSSSQTWNLAVVETVSHPNLEVTVSPPTLYIGPPMTFTLQVRANESIPSGEYEGFVRLTSGTETLHVPYWIRIVNVPILPGNILLVDDDRDTEELSEPLDCSANYISTLNSLDLGESFTYWDTLANGTPTQADMERASAVIWFTCRDSCSSLNFLTPIEGTEATELLNYLEGGGRLFITGQDIAHGSAPSMVAGLGARLCQDSVFTSTGTITRNVSVGGVYNAVAEPIAGGMRFDITLGEDEPESLFLVDEIELSGDNAQPILFALPPNDARCQGIVGVKNASEPTLEAPQQYPGRSVYLSFNFDDINNTSSFNSREELLGNILDWLQDDVSVGVSCAAYGRTVECSATLTSTVGANATEFRWKLDDETALSTGPSDSVVHVYRSPGTYTIRVEVTDSWGHKALGSFTITLEE